MMTVKDKARRVFPKEGSHTALCISQKLDRFGKSGGFFANDPYMVSVLKELCEEGFLYQMTVSFGSVNDLTSSVPRWGLCYFRRDSKKAEELLAIKKPSGYRF